MWKPLALCQIPLGSVCGGAADINLLGDSYHWGNAVMGQLGQKKERFWNRSSGFMRRTAAVPVKLIYNSLIIWSFVVISSQPLVNWNVKLVQWFVHHNINSAPHETPSRKTAPGLAGGTDEMWVWMTQTSPTQIAARRTHKWHQNTCSKELVNFFLFVSFNIPIHTNINLRDCLIVFWDLFEKIYKHSVLGDYKYWTLSKNTPSGTLCKCLKHVAYLLWQS